VVPMIYSFHDGAERSESEPVRLSCILSRRNFRRQQTKKEEDNSGFLGTGAYDSSFFVCSFFFVSWLYEI
jgi:hypothetical protein